MDVKTWLESIGLAQHAASFAENEIDFDLAQRLTNQDLLDLGLSKLSHRKAFLEAISGIRKLKSDVRLAAEIAGERRQATILFADISGFTKLSSQLDVEDLHSLLNRYFDVVDGLVDSFGGTIDKHIGDNVMAVFGAPIAHTNDPERAVRTACSIHASMEQLSLQVAQTLRVHIGIASGQVLANVTGSRSHREYTVTGDAVNLAARLQDLAKPGETLISGSIHRAVSRIASCSSRGEIPVKGLYRPVKVWSFNSLLPEPNLRRGPFVGRQVELAKFETLLIRSLEQGKGSVILVRGEPGIGKTRLVEEFAAISMKRQVIPHKALVLDFGVGKGLGAIQELVRSLLSLPPEASVATRQTAAEYAISSRRTISEDHRIFLNDLLDVPQPAELRSLYEAMDTAARSKGRQETVSALLTTMAPLVVIIEDIHWADQLTMEHIGNLATTVVGISALLVVTERLEEISLDQALPPFVRECLTIMEPSGLPKQEALTLAKEVAGGDVNDVETYVERAEGNPLFLELLLQSASEIVGAKLPDTMQGLVLARIDRLASRDRVALHAASVIGQRFPLDAVRELIENRDYDSGNLVSARLVRQEKTDYFFQHALLRQGIYDSLLKSRRRELHFRAAMWYANRDLVLHSEHLDRATHPEAAGAYLMAAQELAQQLRHEKALQLVRRALEIERESTNSFALRCLEGELLRTLGQSRDSVSSYRQALEAATDDVGRCHAWIGIAEGLRLTGEHNELLTALNQAESAARAQELELELARICQLRGGVHFIRGEIQVCLEVNSQSLDLARNVKSAELESQSLGGLGDAEFARGRMISAHRYYDQCIELAREHDLLRIVAAYLSMRGQTLLYKLNLAAALNDCRTALELASQIRQPRAEMIAAIVGSYVLELSNPDEAQSWSQVGLDIARRLQARVFEASSLENLARFAAQKGEAPKARSLARDAVAILRESESGMRFHGPCAIGVLALVTDDSSERGSALLEGKELLLAGAGAHNHLWFYRDAIEVCLQNEQFDELEQYASALEFFTHDEPLPWADFFIARGRTLAAFRRGQRDRANLNYLERLRDDAQQLGILHAGLALEAALSAHNH